MPTYSVSDVIGKTLIAAKPVDIKRQIQDSSPVVYTVNKGGIIGVVYSWINRDGQLWWMFYDAYNRPYYSRHESGRYDMKALEAQGVVPLEVLQKEKEKEKDPFGFYFDKLTRPLIFIFGGYMLYRAYLDTQKAKK